MVEKLTIDNESKEEDLIATKKELNQALSKVGTLELRIIDYENDKQVDRTYVDVVAVTKHLQIILPRENRA